MRTLVHIVRCRYISLVTLLLLLEDYYENSHECCGFHWLVFVTRNVYTGSGCVRVLLQVYIPSDMCTSNGC